MNTNKSTTEPAQQKPLRLWPGVVMVMLQWLIRFVIPAFLPDALIFGVFGGLLFGLAIVVWWVFFSRTPRFERWFAIVLMIVVLVATSQIIDKSIATANMGLMFVIFSIPVMSLAFVVWAVISRNLSLKLRRATMVATILLASGFWAFLRTDGMDAEVHHDLAWRWAKTAEDRLLENTVDKLKIIPLDSAAMATETEWPGFRGRNRDGIIHGVRIETDWLKTPPVELWRRAIGPGCSSFAVHGVLLYTQEQRGEYEMVTCYNLNTGELVWIHRDSTRFWDSHAGAGPRSTPTLSNGRAYTLGATGILNVLDARNGSVVWSRNVASETNTKIPIWGLSGSPLVVDNAVIVAAAGSLIAYELATGERLWYNPAGGDCYSSPHLLSINGVMQVLLLNEAGVSSVAPNDGQLLWKHLWPGNPILQPVLTPNGDILISVSAFSGIRCIAASKGNDGWNIKERWTSTKLKPNHNDFLIHKGYVYGIDGSGIECIDIENGERKWKGGRYGGQLLLLADQDVLLVLSEKGELALVMATPEQFKELARFPAIKGKTWNHPVLVGDVLVVRNTQEMAAFRLSLAGD